jgi:DNA-binding response OmpR family regulator
MQPSARRGPRVSSAQSAPRGNAKNGARSAATFGLGGGPEARPLPRIAVLDSDSGFLVVLAKRLQREEWEHRVLTPKATPARIVAMEIDALIVDPAVLGARRWSWLERLCQARPELGVIVCTGDSTVAERVRALRFGVDDWLAKPCHPEELIARVEAITQRARRPEQPSCEPVLLGEVEIRPDQFQAFVDGKSLRLTRREYQLMRLLARAPGEILEREMIYECLWGYEMIRNDRSVDVFVHKLRRKLERASPGWEYIHTHFGVGYQLAPRAAGAEVLELEVHAGPASQRLAA